MKIIAKKDFWYRGEFISKGDELKKLSFESIIALNEQGFIEPLSTKDLMNIKKEEKNGTTI